MIQWCKGRLSGICKRVGQVLANAHKTSFSLWYAYAVTAAITAQDYWPKVEQYVPVKWRHGIIEGLTVIVFLDKIRRATLATKPPPP